MEFVGGTAGEDGRGDSPCAATAPFRDRLPSRDVPAGDFNPTATPCASPCDTLLGSPGTPCPDGGFGDGRSVWSH